MDNKVIKTNGKNPYKGLFSYEEKDKDVFYGRKSEQRSLLRLVTHNFLTVIFGKSGIGKTSLIHAGLFPQIREKGFLPIMLRLDYSSPAASLTLQVRERIKKGLETHHILPKRMDADEEAAALGPDETLWEYFHRTRHFDASNGKEITPVLVFDQFEEIFTLGKNHEGVDAFLDELYYLIEDQFPDAVKERLLNEEEVFPYADAKPNVRVIISLREDYLPHLNALKSRVRSIDRITFRVNHLTGTQGREIIGMPGGITDEKVINSILHMFYPEDSEQDIPDEKLEIEPSILSLLCFQLLEKEKEGGAFIAQTDKNRILADFYRSVVDVFPAEVETFIESNLLTEGGFRTPYYLERSHPMRETVDRLVDRRILRKVHYGEKEHIEIIHDVLAPVIKEKRNIRLEEERKREYQKELRRKRRFNRMITAAAIVSILFALFAVERWITAGKQFKKALINSLTAETFLQLPQDDVKAIRIAEVAYKMASPHPPLRLIQVLMKIADSTLGRPFYNVNMQHNSSVYKAVFSPDGSRILTASSDNTAKLWDLKGNPLAEFKYDDFVTTAVFSPDGSRIFTASEDGTAKLWDLKKTRNPLAQFKHDGKLDFARFSPDGSRILTVSYKAAQLWDLKKTRNPLAQFKLDGKLDYAVFSPDGSRILIVSYDNTAQLWDLKGNPLAQFKHNDYVISALFSPDGSRILTASADDTAKLWDLKGNPLAEFKHTGNRRFPVFSPDGGRILTWSKDYTAQLWDLKGNSLAQFKHIHYRRFPVFSPDGSRILTTSQDNTAKLLDLKGNRLAEFKHDSLYSAVFSPDGSRILTASDDTTPKLWDLKGNPLAQFTHDSVVSSWGVFSPDGSRIVTGSEDTTAKLWDLKGNPLAQFKHDSSVYYAVFSPDGSRILTASDDKTAKLWDLKGNPLAQFKHTHYRRKRRFPVFSPDGSRILTWSAKPPQLWELWDLKGNPLAQFKHDKGVSSAVFSQDGSRILTRSADNTAQLWDLKGNPLAQFKHDDYVYSAVFSPDGSRILTTSRDTTAKLWDLKGNPLAQFKHDDDYVTSAVFSPDGSWILTTSQDTAKLWDLKGNALAQFTHDGKLDFARFSPDGNWILIGSKSKTVRLWYTPEGIIHWLKTADIPQLTKEDKERLGIE